jgi:hypothetical protein
MVWLVVAAEWDEAAKWAAERLPSAGLVPLELVTDADLTGAVWSHRVETECPVTSVKLADGRVIDSSIVRGTLNRLIQAPQGAVAALSFDDRDYAYHEFSALFLSWLHSLTGPVLNPASPRGLSGAWRSPAEWASLAVDSGLAASPVSVDPGEMMLSGFEGFRAWPPYAPIAEDAIVAGSAVFARGSLEPHAIEACRKLAAISQTPLLGLAFRCVSCSDVPEVVAITPFPDLRSGGEELIEAIAEALSCEERHT